MNLFKINEDHYNLELLVRVSKHEPGPTLMPEPEEEWELTFAGISEPVIVSKAELDAVIAAAVQ